MTLKLTVAAALVAAAQLVIPAQAEGIHLGPRPLYLVDDMDEGPLKDKLRQCAAMTPAKSDFSIGHRGAPLMFPEHTREGYTAAARMGAGILECDVTFTKDRQLVCRHSQCDLHTSTDILMKPDLAAKCTKPFSPADAASGREAEALCCTSDLTLAEFRTLNGKMDGANKMATTAEDYMKGTARWQTDLYASRGTLMTHAESIMLFKELGTKMTPELKSPTVAMPFDGDYTQEAYAQQMLDEYKAAGIDPKNVYPQSFELADVEYWIAKEPAFAGQAVFLDDRYDTEGFDHTKPETWSPTMEELAAKGVKVLAPPLFMLVRAGEDGKPVPSVYAEKAKAAGLKLITWTLERSGPLGAGGGFYYQSIKDITDNDGDAYEMLNVLAQDVGVIGVFSDWAATTTFYANCVGK